MDRESLAQESLKQALQKLADLFPKLDLTFHQMENGNPGDLTSYWPGESHEEIMVCVFRGSSIREPFHRQDFFFMNFAYRNSYQALSETDKNLITVKEGECYIGQPYSGYALRADGPEEVTIIGLLIRRETFFREYLSTIYTDAALFRFFLDPQVNRFSDACIHLSFARDPSFRLLLETMVLEYAEPGEHTQKLLKSLLQTLLLKIAARSDRVQNRAEAGSNIDRILEYINDHSDQVTLKDLAARFHYHPNYISALLHQKTGRTFQKILLEKRMKRASLLMQNTTLSLEEIASLIGYSNQSNFYKAFKEYYGTTPNVKRGRM